jgi:hypothetical protein
MGCIIYSFFNKIGWCPILAQPWVRSDNNGFIKKNGTPDDKTIGLDLVISGTIIHTSVPGQKICIKYLELFLILI